MRDVISDITNGATRDSENIGAECERGTRALKANTDYERQVIHTLSHSLFTDHQTESGHRWRHSKLWGYSLCQPW